MKDSRASMENVFTDGRLPTLIYANRQESGGDRRDRPMHSHQSICELMICYHGRGIYHIGDETYTISPGDLIYYNAGERHEVLSAEETEIGTYCFGFTGLHFRDLPENWMVLADSPMVRPSGNLFSFFRETADQILDRSRDTEKEKLLFQTLGISLLLMAVQLPAQAPALMQNNTQATRAAAGEIKNYLDIHFTEAVRLEDIARELSLSTDYISHVFKEVTGYSPIEYVIRCRIGMAQTLLISSDLSVTRIASDVGYDNSNYFQTLFKRTVGTTPLRYRRQYLAALKGERDQS